MNRRGFIIATLAAPAIVTYRNLMPVRALAPNVLAYSGDFVDSDFWHIETMPSPLAGTPVDELFSGPSGLWEWKYPNGWKLIIPSGKFGKYNA